MKIQSKRIASCGIITALGIVVMFLGTLLGIGMYFVPMLIGASLTPLGKAWGKQYQILLWLAISLLSFLLISSPEQNLMFFGLFGWYPIFRPVLQQFKKPLRLIAKFLLFNIVIIVLESLLILFVPSEVLRTAMSVLLLALGNVTFLVYDFAIPRFEFLAAKYFRFLFR